MERLFHEEKQKTMFKQKKHNHHALIHHGIRVCSYKAAVTSRKIKDFQKPAMEWHGQKRAGQQSLDR